MTVRGAKKSGQSGRSMRGKGSAVELEAEPKKAGPPKTASAAGRYAAARVRLGMTPGEVRSSSGKPECILYGAEDHVEWQFGVRGTDPVGAPVLYVTTLTFAAGRVVRITERMAEAH